jgi:hypothetical protein
MLSKSVCLRIIGVGSKHDAIARTLNVSPSATRAKGEPFPEWAASLKEPPIDNDVWILNSPISEEADVHKHLEYFATLLTPAEEAIAHLKAEGARIEVMCILGTDQRGIHLGVPLGRIGILSRLGVDVKIYIVNFAKSAVRHQ